MQPALFRAGARPKAPGARRGPQGAENQPETRGRIYYFILPKVCPVEATAIAGERHTRCQADDHTAGALPLERSRVVWVPQLSGTYIRKLKYKFEFRFWVGFWPKLGPGP